MRFLRENNNRLKSAEATPLRRQSLRTEMKNVSILRLPKVNQCNMLAEQTAVTNIRCLDVSNSQSPRCIKASP